MTVSNRDGFGRSREPSPSIAVLIEEATGGGLLAGLRRRVRHLMLTGAVLTLQPRMCRLAPAVGTRQHNANIKHYLESSTMHLKRGLYRDEDRAILPALQQIESAYDILLKLPTSDSASFHPVATYREAAEKGDYQTSCLQLFLDSYNWLKFFFYTNIFKMTKLTEGLIHSYNSQNYLVWAVLARSSIEYSAVFYYFLKKLEQFKLSGPAFAGTHLQGFEDLMIQYAHGTRFNWQDLMMGNRETLTKSFAKDESRPQSINVLTAIQKLKGRDERFKDIELAYSMLSDFVHPNMASHCAVVEMPHEPGSMHQCVMSLNPRSERGEFFMVITLPWAAMALGNFIELLPPLGRLVGAWLELLDAGERITIDFTS